MYGTFWVSWQDVRDSNAIVNMENADFFIFQGFEKCLDGTNLPIIFYVDNLSETLFAKYLP
jgi:hypothetical protein